MLVNETQETWSGKQAGILAGITYRQVDHWCRAGLFGEERRAPGSGGTRRRFTSEDVVVMRTLGQVSAAWSVDCRRLGAGMTLLQEIADRIRAGDDIIEIKRVPSITILINVGMNR